MVYYINNDCLTVGVSDKGAEIISVKNADGCEYIWQGDEKYWAGHAPTMFPICGRLFGGKYTYGEKEYEMKLHGFARHEVFTLKEFGEDSIAFELKENENTLSQYPFPFTLTVEYRLCENKLTGKITVHNSGDQILPFAIGLHPGFNLPLGDGSFEDCYVEFTKPCYPDKILLSDTCFVSGKREAFYLEDSRRLSLHHGLFDNDAIFLSRVSNELTLRSSANDRYVCFSFEGFPYLGFWHAPKTDAPYICIEPWSALPSRQDVVEEFTCKSDMTQLNPGDFYENSWTVTVF